MEVNRMPEQRQKLEIQTEITGHLEKMKEMCDTGLALAKTLENADETSRLFDFLENFNEETDEIRPLIFELEDTFFSEETEE
jgi:hypothetical protein